MSNPEHRPASKDIQIKDPRYDGGVNRRNLPITPNIDWEPPIHHPFKLDELVAVHLTDQDARKTRVLKPHTYTPYKFDTTIWPDEWLQPRETLSFTLNGPVADHSGGVYRTSEANFSWKDKRFAYLVPLKDVYDQTLSVFTHDTVVIGEVALPDTAVIIDNQNTQKISNTVAQLGYQPLDLRGVKTLDPAYLLGTKKNINHPDNFASMINNGLVDGPYTEASDNNILILDTILGDVLIALGPRVAVINISRELIGDVQRRMSFLTDRYANDPKRGPGISRLQKIVTLYTKAMQTEVSYLEEYDKKPRKTIDTIEEHNAMMEASKTHVRQVGDFIRWQNASKAIAEK
jgi:hypothetical protein